MPHQLLVEARTGFDWEALEARVAALDPLEIFPIPADEANPRDALGITIRVASPPVLAVLADFLRLLQATSGAQVYDMYSGELLADPSEAELTRRIGGVRGALRL